MKTITTTTTLATTEVFPLAGPCRLRADDLVAGDAVLIYEERVDGEYDPVILYDDEGNHKGYLHLTKVRPSVRFEGYGNYKAVVPRAGIAVGYDEG